MPSATMQLDELGSAFLHQLADSAPTGRAASFRFTENGADVTPGGGRLATAECFTGLQVYADQASGQVVLAGLAEFGDGRDAFALRLRIEAGLVTEAETVLSTGRTGFFNAVDELAKPDIVYLAPVPEARRSRADELIRIANSYWEGMEHGDGSGVPVGYRCDSFHNGKKVTNNLELLLSPDKAVHTVASIIACTRPARPTIVERRFPIVDVELGLVVSLVVADFHPIPNGRPDNGSFYMAVIFKIVDHEIRIFDEIREILPLGTTSGWPGAQGAR